MRLRVLFIVPQPIEGPSSRFRVYQFLDYLQANGVDATVRPLLSSRLAAVVYRRGGLAAKVQATLWAAACRVADVSAAFRYDVAYVLREAFPFGPPLAERALGRAAGRLIFDFDDAIYMPSLAYRNPLDRFRDFDKPRKLIAMASRVVVGSDYLRDYALRFARTPDHVAVVPTVVDTTVYCPRPAPKASPEVTIGWIGTPRGSGYLLDLLEPIRALSREFPQVAFRFVGAEPFATQGLPITFKTWRLDDELADLQSFDIGIMPLTDDEETRGKCGFKLIQYMSVGIPVLCSPVGANRTIVEEGVNGYFASTPEQWLAGLRRLVGDAGTRERLGQRGRGIAQARYSREAVAPRLLSILREAAA